jgi:IPT/TIG domain-containing protein
MVPLRDGGNRVWRAWRRIRNGSLSAAACASLVLAAVLGQSSLATAQPVTPGADPGFFPATGYRISSPALLDYFQHRGGVRTFGYPVSNEFPLLGKRVQLFQRQMLEIDADGSVIAANILDPAILPITHIDGLSLPAADPDVIAAAPTADSPDYATQALAFINVYVPDDWNGMPVNFQSTFLNTVTCTDAFGSDSCDPSELPAFDLQLWGLPTSLPMSDPLNTDFVYQRFQRGIMHFSRLTGLTQGLLLGDWLKRVMIGVDLSPDLNPEVRQSRLFAQFAPSRPLALDRPADLPDTSLAQAFRSDTLVAAGQMQPEPTLPTNVAQTATSVALTSTAISATQAALNNQQTFLTATALALTATAAVSQATATPTPGGVISTVPVVNVGCLGDEQMWFVPRKPNLGVHVQISITSQRHHDARSMALAGPLDSGPVVEHEGPLGFIWTWTIVPTVEGFYQWTFFADGLRPCITSGFNAFAPLGATPTPTLTPQPTNTPGATATPTPQTAPTAQGFTPSSGGCGDPISVFGQNFGTPQQGQQIPTGGQVLFGSRSATIVSWTNGSITMFPPPGSTSSAYTIIVVNSGGSSRAPGQYTLTVSGTNNSC